MQEGALAYAWSVVPTVNPGVVWCSFLRRPGSKLLLFYMQKITDVRTVLSFISFEGTLAESWTNRKTTGRMR